jgi:cytidine deaminase
VTEISDDELVARALAARSKSYAPYSKFRVGAALRTGNQVYEAANVENASYGLCICAERGALLQLAWDGGRDFDVIAVATDASPPSSPCGMCRQSLRELTRDPARSRVIAVNPAGERRSWTVAELIPDGFSGAELPDPRA